MTHNFSDIHDGVNNSASRKTFECFDETKKAVWNTYHWRKYFPKMAEVNPFYTSISWVGSRAHKSLREDINFVIV